MTVNPRLEEVKAAVSWKEAVRKYYSKIRMGIIYTCICGMVGPSCKGQGWLD